MKTTILAAIAALTLGVAVANAGAAPYRAPAYNSYQNNWMGGDN